MDNRLLIIELCDKEKRERAFFVLNLGFDIVDGVAGLDLESDGLAGEGFHEDLHGGWLLPLLARVSLYSGSSCSIYRGRILN